MERNFLDTLRENSKETGSIACMGLDPVIDAMPERFARRGIEGVPDFFDEIFDEMEKQEVLPGAFKPNQGFYVGPNYPREEFFKGSKALARVMGEIRERFPHIPIILDYKRGDIAKSSDNYAVEGFESWCADAVTISPYMGTDSVMPFIEMAVKGAGGVYILNRTSNPGAEDLQSLMVEYPTGEGTERMPLYMAVAHKIVDWAKGNPGVGAVIGATSPEELSQLTRFYSGKDISLLIPGVGGQGGKADEVVKRLEDDGYDLGIVRINSSSGLTHPWVKQQQSAPEDYAKVCVRALDKLNCEIGYKA